MTSILSISSGCDCHKTLATRSACTRGSSRSPCASPIDSGSSGSTQTRPGVWRPLFSNSRTSGKRTLWIPTSGRSYPVSSSPKSSSRASTDRASCSCGLFAYPETTGEATRGIARRWTPPTSQPKRGRASWRTCPSARTSSSRPLPHCRSPSGLSRAFSPARDRVQRSLCPLA